MVMAVRCVDKPENGVLWARYSSASMVMGVKEGAVHCLRDNWKEAFDEVTLE